MIVDDVEVDLKRATDVLAQLQAAPLRRILAALGGADPGGVEQMVATLEPGRSRTLRLEATRLPGLIVALAGFDLLLERKVRHELASALDMDTLGTLHESSPASGQGGRSHASRASAVAGVNWHPGKYWARRFTEAVGLPTRFAGLRTERPEPERLEATPFVPLPALTDFQDELRLGILDTLRGAPGDNRAIVTLPTGAGKTRTAVEAIVQWLRESESHRTVLWIAQTDELCEQAVQAFREVWVDLGQRMEAVRESLIVWRLWSTRPMPEEPVDVVVASIQKLQAQVRVLGADPQEPLWDVNAIIVDEAHRALARSYGEVMRNLGIDFRKRSALVPLLGLTATPIRTAVGETEALRRRFHDRVLESKALGADARGVLQSRLVLAQIDTEVLVYDSPLAFELSSLDSEDRSQFEQFDEIPQHVLKRLGSSLSRNQKLIERLEGLPPDWPTLVFASSVNQARALAAVLRSRGRSADSVTAETRASTRRALIERFRQGRTSILCNYGVLTTGFDAPVVRSIVVARPTASRILYEQMVGRGLRGPKFGGTQRCLVIDVAENIRYRGKDVIVRYEDAVLP